MLTVKLLTPLLMLLNLVRREGEERERREGEQGTSEGLRGERTRRGKREGNNPICRQHFTETIMKTCRTIIVGIRERERCSININI